MILTGVKESNLLLFKITKYEIQIKLKEALTVDFLKNQELAFSIIELV